jgi:hypothetical protein
LATPNEKQYITQLKKNLSNNTAIIFFSRSASCEADRKPFLKTSFKSNKRIAESLIDHSLAIIKQTEFPFYIFDETRQTGKTFNERLLSAIDYGFTKGHSSLVIIGNDCPQLTAKELLIASEKLKSNDFVIGPNYNGGLYLIGLTKSAAYNSLITNIKWQTSTVAKNTLSWLSASTADYFLLSTLSDFNNINDYVFLKDRLTVYNKFSIVIKSILASYSLLFYLNKVIFLQSIQLSAEQLRGPPALNRFSLT